MYSHLKDMLIDKALGSISIAHSLQWHLSNERQNGDNKPATKLLYQNIWEELMSEMSKQSPDLHKGILQGINIMERMNAVTTQIKTDSELNTIDKRKEALRREIADKDSEHYLADLGAEGGLQSPLLPKYRYFGAVPQRCTLFTSAI